MDHKTSKQTSQVPKWPTKSSPVVFARSPKNTTCLQALRLHDVSMTVCLQGTIVFLHTFHDLTRALVTENLPRSMQAQRILGVGLGLCIC